MGSCLRWWCARLLVAVVAAAVLSVRPAEVSAQGVGAELIAELNLANFGVEGVTAIRSAPGRPHDLFVGILDGRILRVDLTDNSVSPFAVVPDIDQSGATGFFGLHGFTFHPDFATNGQLYVHVADERDAAAGVHHRNYVRRYELANPFDNAPAFGAGTNILRYDQPRHDHNGGFLGFQPGDNNTLWIATGDGGNNDGDPDPSRTGQNTDDLLGSILRIDISGDDFPADVDRNYKIPVNNPFADGVGGQPEIWSYGIRSPWGASFDRATGDFIFGDVGQVTREEINFERAGSAGDRNYGWRVKEGVAASPFAQETGDPAPDDPSLVDPVFDYIHTGGYGSGNSLPFTGRSVTGGYVYRGAIVELQGKYIFGDWSSRQVWAMTIDRDANGGAGGIVPGSRYNLAETFDRTSVYGGGGGFGDGVTAFGEDTEGNLYFAELDGTLYKVCAACGPGLPEAEPEPLGPRGPMKLLEPLRDDFTMAFNYQTGAVPAGGIWTDAHNASVGDTFAAHSANAGQLTIGMERVGWGGGGEDTAPFLFREVEAENLLEIRVKLTSQSRNNWSAAGILVRAAGPLDDDASNDNFLSAHSFRPNLTGSIRNTVQVANVTNGAEAETNAPVTEEDLAYLRLVHFGNGEFQVFSSPNGTTWMAHDETVNANLASGLLEVGVWAGNYPTGSASGSALFDWVEIVLGVPAGDFNSDGVIDAGDYTVWRDAAGSAVAAWSGADGNGDGIVDGADYDVWKQNFGKSIPNLGGTGRGGAVPEPNALMLLALVAAIACWPRFARRPEQLAPPRLTEI